MGSDYFPLADTDEPPEDDGYRDPRDRYSDLRSFDAQWTPDDLEELAKLLTD